jgi:hypothetical protein
MEKGGKGKPPPVRSCELSAELSEGRNAPANRLAPILTGASVGASPEKCRKVHKRRKVHTGLKTDLVVGLCGSAF